MKTRSRFTAIVVSLFVFAAAAQACFAPGAYAADLIAGSALNNADSTGISFSTMQTQSANVLESGVWGTCKWQYTSDETLTIYPGENWFERTTISDNTTNYRTEYRTNLMEVNGTIRHIVFKSEGNKKVIAPSHCNNLFSGLGSLESVDFSGLDTSNVVDMSGMFRVDRDLGTLQSYFNNWSCDIESVDLSCLDLSNVTNMDGMFANCESLVSVNLSGVDLSSVTDMSGMFYNCNCLKSINMASLNCSNVTSIAWMFRDCANLKSVSLPAFSSTEPVNMNSLFWECSSLETFDCPSWNKQPIENAAFMFMDCSLLSSFDGNSIDLSNVTDMEGMFCGCSSLRELDTSSWSTGSCSRYQNAFKGCSLVKTFDLSHFSTSNSKDELARFTTAGMFDECDSVERIVIGKGVKHLASFPSNEINGLTGWFSQEAKRVVSFSEIYQGRLGRADVYTKYIPVEYLGFYMKKNATYSGNEQRPDTYLFLKGASTRHRLMPWGSFEYTDNETLLERGVDYDVTYYNNVDAGEAVAVITGRGVYTGSIGYAYTIVPAEITSAKLASTMFTYNGKTQKPKVASAAAGSVAADPASYSVKFENDKSCNVGTYKVTITGKGNFTGAKTLTYKISPATISAVSLSPSILTYTGKAQKPSVSAVKAGAVAVDASGYTVAYANASSKKAGAYNVTVSGKGNFTGSKTVTYKIKQASNKAVANKTSVKKTIKRSAVKKKAQSITLPKVTTKFGKAKWKVTSKDKKKALSLSEKKIKVKRGTKKGTYTIKLKAKVAKTANYKAASTKTVTVKVKVK